jgi:uncharacterized protein YprB with RNaseH-like and TPR domain
VITIEKCLDLPKSYPLSRIGEPEQLLFFDIETTGLSAERSKLYLIGCVSYRKGAWRLIQWFADTADSERQLLLAFFEYLKDFSCLVHFNGDSFDIPYLQKRCAALGLDCSFSNMPSFDIYKKIKPFKKLLGLENLKQKSIERFLGINREDCFSGGQLIEVYENYLNSGNQDLYRLLMLHNEEDLKGMPAILPILSYPDFFRLPVTPAGWKEIPVTDAFGNEELLLCLFYESPVSLPSPVAAEASPFVLEADKHRLCLKISLFYGEMKRFYPNYKDYYYLIYEDTAVHKSIGEYVECSARKKATAKTCYTKTKGLFLPQPSPVLPEYVKRDYSDRLTYVPCSRELLDSLCPSVSSGSDEKPGALLPLQYLSSVLSLFGLNSV